MATGSGEGTFLKRTADGREVISSSIDEDAGEVRLGAMLNLVRFDNPDDGEGGSEGSGDSAVTAVTPDSGPYNAATEVVFTGNFPNSGAGNYVVRVLVGDAYITAPITDRTDTEITATLPAGNDTDGLLSVPGPVMVAVAERPGPGDPFVTVDDAQSFTYTAAVPVAGMSPNSGPWSADNEVVFSGTFDPEAVYGVQMFLASDPEITSGFTASGPVTSTTLTAMLQSGPDTDGVVPGPGPCQIRVRKRVDNVWVDQDNVQTFNFTVG